MPRMTPSEALVETLAAHKVTDVFGIVGSAYMDALDIFPAAGIRFIPTAHEQGAAHMADGYARMSGKHGVCIAQNGPGVTNFVTAVAAAYWAHTPMLVVTPETGSGSLGLGGFQETEQMPIFSKITRYQAHVNRPDRIAEMTARCLDLAMIERGPAQLNIPRDYFYGEFDGVISPPQAIERGPGGERALDDAARLLAAAKAPVIIAGGGVVFSPGGIDACKALAEKLRAPVANSYLHNDSFPASHPLWVGPLGYQGSKAAMRLLMKADVVLALGTRLGPFGTLPQHGLDYWPRKAKLIQIDSDHRVLGLVKPATTAICGDAAAAAKALLARLKGARLSAPASRPQTVAAEKQKWEKELSKWSSERDEWSVSEAKRDGGAHPREVLRALENAAPKAAMVSTDIGNICSVANSYLRFEEPGFLAAMSFGNCGYAFPTAIGAKVARPKRPAIAYVGDGAWGMSFCELLTCAREDIPVTAVVFHNRQWGAEKKNQVDFYGRRFLGVNIDADFAAIARAMGAEGVRVDAAADAGDALRDATRAQLKDGKTTVIEVGCSRELGDPFRRDALKAPKRLLKKYRAFE